MIESPAAARQRFTGIEAARGIAATLVAAHHASRLIAQSRYAGSLPFGGLFDEFYVGVDFFFVLSGFLITWVHWADIGQPGRLGRYAFRRVTRIYPAYWVALAPILVARLLRFGSLATTAPGPVLIVSSVLLLPGPTQPLLGVAWSLVFEMFFYVLFGLVIATGRWSFTLLLVWAGVIVAVNVAGGATAFPASFFLSPYNLEFLFGVAVAWLLRRHAIAAPRLLAILGGGLFVGLMIGRVDISADGSGLALRLMFGLPAALFILGTVELEQAGKIRVPRWLGQLGAASYSIYLVHSMIEPAVMLLGWRFLSALPPEIVTLGLTAIGVAGGFVFHWFVEAPVMAAIRRRSERRRSVPA